MQLALLFLLCQVQTLTQENTKLRAATLDDVEALTELSHHTILAKYPDVIGREAVEGFVASGAVPKYYTDNNAHCVVAVQSEVPVGVYATKDATVDLMMVTLAHHRTGVGTLLLAAAEKELFEKHPRLSLDSFRDNQQANNFYQKHGWALDHHFNDPVYGIPTVRFVK
jgi:GNAT superfamily N-acetyltransferase